MQILQQRVSGFSLSQGEGTLGTVEAGPGHSEETEDEASSCPLIQQVYSLEEEADSAQARGKTFKELAVS